MSIAAFSNSSDVVWTENMIRFQSESSVFKFLRRSVTRHQLYELHIVHMKQCCYFKSEFMLSLYFQYVRVFLSYFFVKKIYLSRRVEYVVDGSMDQ